MRVLFLSWRDTTHPDGGGSEVYVEQVAAGLAARGHDVTVLCAAHDGRSGRHRARRRAHRAARWPADGLPARAGLPALAGRAAYRRGRRRRERPAVRGAAGAPTRAGRPRAPPAPRAVADHLPRPRRSGGLVRGVTRGAPALPLGPVRDGVRARAAATWPGSAWPPAGSSVVRNGTPPLPAPRLPRSATPRLCVLSRLVPHKRIEQVLAVVDELRHRHPGLVLDVIGDGWWADELDAEIARRGLADVVVRHGRVDEQTKADLLGRAWLMVLPSVREGWGIAVMEAAAAGTPTVAYAVRGRDGGVGGGRRHRRAGATTRPACCARSSGCSTTRSARERLGRAARERAATFGWDEAAAGVERVLPARATRRRRAGSAPTGSGRGRPSATARARTSPRRPTRRR